MFFLIIYIYCFILFAILFMVQETSETQTKNYFLEDDEDDEEDELNDDTKYEKDKYEDKYKINKELVDEDLSQEKLEGLCNCFILDHTPNGNVLILYNHNTTSFIYYSDASIPYKYLNALARKYVNTYRCKKLYITSEEQLKKVDAEVNVGSDVGVGVASVKQKKEIFAKFKTYNKSTNKIQSQSRQQHQGQLQGQLQGQSEKTEVIANRYTYQGKIANFNFLKKTDKKLVNKKLSLKFSDYKKLQN